MLGESGEDAEIMVTIGMISFRNYNCFLTMPMIHSYTGAVLVGSCGFFVCLLSCGSRGYYLEGLGCSDEGHITSLPAF